MLYVLETKVLIVLLHTHTHITSTLQLKNLKTQ